MADITVRNIRFSFGEALDFEVPDDKLGDMLGPLALSMTMPHLEPYLIRTMKVARTQIRDPALVEEMRRPIACAASKRIWRPTTSASTGRNRFASTWHTPRVSSR